jgi:hypothetical protein
MFNKQVSISIQFREEKEYYLPGQTVHATITLLAPQKTKIRALDASLVHAWRYARSVSQDQPGVASYMGGSLLDVLAPVFWAVGQSREPKREEWVSGEASTHPRLVAGDTVLEAGALQTFTCELEVPVSAVPTYSGEIIESKWSLHVSADLAMSRDATVQIEVPIRTVPPREKRQREQQHEEVAMFAGMRSMKLELPGVQYTSGEVIRGRLHIESAKDLEARAVRVELWNAEHVPGAISPNVRARLVRSQTIANHLLLQAGVMQDLAFNLPISGVTASSFQGEDFEILWVLKGVVDTGWEDRPTIVQKLDLHAALSPVDS